MYVVGQKIFGANYYSIFSMVAGSFLRLFVPSSYCRLVAAALFVAVEFNL